MEFFLYILMRRYESQLKNKQVASRCNQDVASKKEHDIFDLITRKIQKDEGVEPAAQSQKHLCSSVDDVNTEHFIENIFPIFDNFGS